MTIASDLEQPHEVVTQYTPQKAHQMTRSTVTIVLYFTQFFNTDGKCHGNIILEATTLSSVTFSNEATRMELRMKKELTPLNSVLFTSEVIGV